MAGKGHLGGFQITGPGCRIHKFPESVIFNYIERRALSCKRIQKSTEPVEMHDSNGVGGYGLITAVHGIVQVIGMTVLIRSGI